MRHKKDKKAGSMFDLVFIVPIIFTVIVVLFIVKTAWGEMSVELLNDEFIGNTTEGRDAMNTATSTVNGFNYLLPFCILLIIIIMFVLAYTVDISPGMIFFAIIMLFIAVLLSAMFSNMFSEISAEPDFENATDTFTAPAHIMDNLPIYILISGLLMIVLMYSRNRSQAGGESL